MSCFICYDDSGEYASVRFETHEYCSDCFKKYSEYLETSEDAEESAILKLQEKRLLTKQKIDNTIRMIRKCEAIILQYEEKMAKAELKLENLECKQDDLDTVFNRVSILTKSVTRNSKTNS